MHKRQCGFSLLEVLIAVIILGVSALGLIKLNGLLLQGTTSAMDRQQATRLAEGVMEEVRHYARIRKTLPVTLNDVEFAGSGTERTSTVATPTGNLSVYLNFDTVPNWTNTTAVLDFNAQVRVKWTGADGQAQFVQLTSEIVQNPAAETAATAICKWSAGHPFAKGKLTIEEGSIPTGGTDGIYLCISPAGCTGGGGPKMTPGSWKLIGPRADFNGGITATAPGACT